MRARSPSTFLLLTLLASQGLAFACRGAAGPVEELERPDSGAPRPGDGTGPRRSRVDVEQRFDLGRPVPVRINGRGPFWMGLDTGQSPALILARRTFEALGLEVQARVSTGDGSGHNAQEVELVRLDRIDVGSARFGDALGIVMDIEGDGSLGFSLFAGCLLTLDYGAGSMRLAEGALPAIDGTRVLGLDMNRGATPAITVQVGERDEPVIIDSAWAGFLAFPLDRAGSLPLAAPPEITGRFATLFNEFDLYEATLACEVRIGALVFAAPRIQFHELFPETVLGHDCLELLRVTFDQRNGRIALDPSGS